METKAVSFLIQLMDKILHRFSCCRSIQQGPPSPDTHSMFNIEQERPEPKQPPLVAPKSCTGGAPPKTASQH